MRRPSPGPASLAALRRHPYDHFAIQASNPLVVPRPGHRVATLVEAITAIFPAATEEAYLLWNWIPIRVSYKYDLYVMIDDIPGLLGRLLDTAAGDHRVFWGSNTFRAEWRLGWSDGQIDIAALWRSVAGGYEALLNTRGRLVVEQDEFVREWKALLNRLIASIDASGIEIADRRQVDTIRNIEATIPRFGQFYEER